MDSQTALKQLRAALIDMRNARQKIEGIYGSGGFRAIEAFAITLPEPASVMVQALDHMLCKTHTWETSIELIEQLRRGKVSW